MAVSMRDYRFFRAHAGYIVGRRAECAIALARAEREARERGFVYEWEPDADGDLGDHEYWCDSARRGIEHEHEITACVAYNEGGHVVGSLCGIIDADSTYRRVVEAEIAADYLNV